MAYGFNDDKSKEDLSTYAKKDEATTRRDITVSYLLRDSDTGTGDFLIKAHNGTLTAEANDIGMTEYDDINVDGYFPIGIIGVDVASGQTPMTSFQLFKKASTGKIGAYLYAFNRESKTSTYSVTIQVLYVKTTLVNQ